MIRRFFRRCLQWPIFYAGLLLHGFSFHTIRSDEDTREDWHANVSLDRPDADGALQDGIQEAWWRIWRLPGYLRHDLKNYPREWIEVVHPKTSARVWGLTLWIALVIGWTIGRFV